MRGVSVTRPPGDVPDEAVVPLLRAFASRPHVQMAYEPATRVSLAALLVATADAVESLRGRVADAATDLAAVKESARMDAETVSAVISYLDIPDHLCKDEFVAFKDDLRAAVAEHRRTVVPTEAPK